MVNLGLVSLMEICEIVGSASSRILNIYKLERAIKEHRVITLPPLLPQPLLPYPFHPPPLPYPQHPYPPFTLRPYLLPSTPPPQHLFYPIPNTPTLTLISPPPPPPYPQHPNPWYPTSSYTPTPTPPPPSLSLQPYLSSWYQSPSLPHLIRVKKATI